MAADSSSSTIPGTGRPSGWPPSTGGSAAEDRPLRPSFSNIEDHHDTSCPESLCPWRVVAPGWYADAPKSPGQRGRPGQERGREPEALPARTLVGRRGLRG